jgi:hypothetical protein
MCKIQNNVKIRKKKNAHYGAWPDGITRSKVAEYRHPDMGNIAYQYDTGEEYLKVF